MAALEETHEQAAPPAKTARVDIRVAPEDRSMFHHAAVLAHETLTEFMVESARERAERLLADRTEFALDADAWQTFVEALERPAEVKPEVVDLFRRPRPK